MRKSLKHKSRIIPLTLDNAVQVRIFLSRLIVGVMNGEVEPKLAGTVGYLAGMLLKSIEVSDLEIRLNNLEKVSNEINEQRRTMLQ